MVESLIVNLDEFSDLCQVTPETMRAHIKALDHEPIWLIKRGGRGSGYEIEALGGRDWWLKKTESDAAVEEERKQKLQQLRLDIIGDQAEDGDSLSLSGRQRREEYAAGLEAIKYRRTMGELVERAEMESELSSAAVELRRRLMLLPAEFVIEQGLPKKHVKPLKDLLKKAIDEFVKSISLVEGRDVP